MYLWLNLIYMYVTYLIIYSGEKLPPYYIGSTSLKKIENGYRGSVKSKKYSEIFKNELIENFDLFEVLILSEHVSRKEAYEAELRLQIKYDVVKSKYFYNQALASAGGMAGMDISGKNNPMYGKKHSEEAKDKMRKKRGHDKRYVPNEQHKKIISKTHLNKLVSDETKKKLSESKRGKYLGENAPFYGKKHTEEAKIKISKKNKGRIVSEETKKILSIYGKNKILSEETKKKISESKRGIKRTFTPEWCENISKGNVGRIVSSETKKKLKEPRNSTKSICPYCGKYGGGGNMKRYHFDNCKHK